MRFPRTHALADNKRGLMRARFQWYSGIIMRGDMDDTSEILHLGLPRRRARSSWIAGGCTPLQAPKETV